MTLITTLTLTRPTPGPLGHQVRRRGVRLGEGDWCGPTCCTNSCSSICRPPPAGSPRYRRWRRPSVLSVGAGRIRGDVAGSVAGDAGQGCDSDCTASRRVRGAGDPRCRPTASMPSSGGRAAVRRRVVPRRARIPRTARAAGRAVVPVRRRWRPGLDHDRQRQGDGGPSGAGAAMGGRARRVRCHAPRSGCSACPAEPTRWRNSASCCSARRGTDALVRGVAVRRLAGIPSYRSTPADVAAVGEVEFQASLREPYRQLSRVFHLVGRRASELSCRRGIAATSGDRAQATNPAISMP